MLDGPVAVGEAHLRADRHAAAARDVLVRAAQPAEFCNFHFAPRYKDHHQKLKFAKGTTTLAFKFKGGVLNC